MRVVAVNTLTKRQLGGFDARIGFLRTVSRRMTLFGSSLPDAK